MASNIGIKIANGEFYPIMEENSLIRKRLILTTVHDNQPSVQIDLFRSAAGAMTDAQYIGSLVVEKIKPKPKGEPSIEMVISSNSKGEIVAEAIDLDTSTGGEHYVLTVSLKSLDETTRDLEIPDFELESNEEPPSGLFQHAKTIRQEKKKSSLPVILIIIGLIILLGLAAAWLLLLGGMEKVNSYFSKQEATRTERREPPPEPVKTVEPVIQEPVKQPEPVRQPDPPPQRVEPAPVIQAPPAPPPPRPQTTARKRPSAPVASYKVPATIPKEGVDYRIRWGDTLWDIADAFYRNPWLYPRIARHNNIRNPDLIISGRTIRIPPKN
jgi:outer membrane biosynthesis protein TonB